MNNSIANNAGNGDNPFEEEQPENANLDERGAEEFSESRARDAFPELYETDNEREIRQIVSGTASIQTAFENNDRHILQFRQQVVRYKRLICNTQDHIQRHNYLKFYKDAEKKFIYCMVMTKKLIDTSKKVLTRILQLPNQECQYEKQLLNRLIAEHRPSSTN